MNRVHLRQNSWPWKMKSILESRTTINTHQNESYRAQVIILADFKKILNLACAGPFNGGIVSNSRVGTTNININYSERGKFLIMSRFKVSKSQNKSTRLRGLFWKEMFSLEKWENLKVSAMTFGVQLELKIFSLFNQIVSKMCSS